MAKKSVQTAPTFHIASLPRGQAMLILGAAALMISVGMGIRQSLGLFQTPVSRDLGIKAADFAFAIAIQNIIWGVTQPFIGAVIDRFGPRWVAMSGGVLYACALAITAMATSSLGVLVGAGVMVGVALACTTSAIGANIAARVVVPERRSLAFGIVSAAGSLGTFFAAPLGQVVIQQGGWRMGMWVFMGLALLLLPAAFIGGAAGKIPNANRGDASLTLRSALHEAWTHSGFVVMTLAFFVCGLQLVFLTTHLPTYLALCGLDPMLSAKALATIGLFNVAGSWLFGWLGDRYRKRTLLGMIYVLRSGFLALYFLLPASEASTLVFAAFMGLLWLGVIPLVNGLVSEIFGIRYLATLTGISFLSHQVGSFLGAWGGGAIFDALGTYDRAVQFGVIVGLIAGCFQLLMNDRPLARMGGEATGAAPPADAVARGLAR
jgi:predicted MFS family arabinose efflux permease